MKNEMSLLLIIIVVSILTLAALVYIRAYFRYRKAEVLHGLKEQKANEGSEKKRSLQRTMISRLRVQTILRNQKRFNLLKNCLLMEIF